MIDALLAGPVLLVVAAERLVARVVWLLRRINDLGPLRRLRGWLGRQPPSRALPMFLVPELTSRSGTVASAWLLVCGHPWQALSVYTTAKLFAGVVALWVYSACEPALLRIRWFAAAHGWVLQARHSLLAQPSAAATRRPSRFAVLRAAVKARSSTASRAPATPSAPTGRGRTG